ncbi:MAG: antibiotic biosynthesis monooxygenase [Pseudobdellovibrionaceae bacterium]|nr:antibiotic biosynthesis monooxygenase [Pseudobdellovibrionaceae bacterium]
MTAEPFLAPKISYYVVIFSSYRHDNDNNGYENMASRMIELAKGQVGFLGVESARNPDGLGITTSYWETLESINKWKQNVEHKLAQSKGRSDWYEAFKTRVARIEYEYEFISSSNAHNV